MAAGDCRFKPVELSRADLLAYLLIFVDTLLILREDMDGKLMMED